MASELHLSDDKWKWLRKRIVAATLSQLITKLSLIQSSVRRYNALVSCSTPAKARRRSSCPPSGSQMPNGGSDNNMPSPRILDAIMLDKELEMLANLCNLACAEVLTAAAGDHNDGDDDDDDDGGGETICLRAAIEAHQNQHSKHDTLALTLRENHEELAELKSQLAAEQEVAKQRMTVQDIRIGELRHSNANLRCLNELELSLVRRWEEVRCSQAQIWGENEERALLRAILVLQTRMANEERIMCDVKSYSDLELSNLSSRIAEWQQKYATEMAIRLAETHEHEKCIANLDKQFERHHETYEMRLQFMNAYLAEKAEEQRLYELQLQRVQSAIRIQAWWRGVMVRLGLGPYKKKAKKGKGKGKSKSAK